MTITEASPTMATNTTANVVTCTIDSGFCADSFHSYISATNSDDPYMDDIPAENIPIHRHKPTRKIKRSWQCLSRKPFLNTNRIRRRG